MLLILVGRLAQIGLTLALTKTATTLLLPGEYGRTALISSTISLFSLLLVNPVGMFINRRLHVWAQAGTLMSHLRVFGTYLLGVAFVSTIAVFVGKKVGVFDFGTENVWLIGLVCGSLIATTLNQTYIPALNMLGRRTSFVVFSVLTLALNFVLSVAFVIYGSASAELWMLGTFVSQAFFALLGGILLGRSVPRVREEAPAFWPERSKIRTLFDFAWPVSLAVGLTWLQAHGYRYLVESRYGLDQLGYFVAGYGVASGVMSAFESVLHAYFLPKFYSDVNESEAAQVRAWNEYAYAVIPSLALTAAFVAAFASPLSIILLGPKFHDVAVFASIGALIEAGRCFAGAYALIAHAKMKTRLLIPPAALGAVFALGLVSVVMNPFGLVGTAWALGAAGFAVVVFMHFRMNRVMPVRFPVARTAMALVGGGLLALLALGISSFGMMPSNLLNSLVVVGGAGCVYALMQHGLLKHQLKS